MKQKYLQIFNQLKFQNNIYQLDLLSNIEKLSRFSIDKHTLKALYMFILLLCKLASSINVCENM